MTDAESILGPPTEAEIAATLARLRDRDFARWVSLTITLAAKAEPDMVREALASVFDLKAVENYLKLANQRASKAMAAAEEAERKLRSLNAAIEDTAKRIDSIHFDMDRFALRMSKAKKFLVWLRDVAANLKQQQSRPKGAGPAGKPAPGK